MVEAVSVSDLYVEGSGLGGNYLCICFGGSGYGAARGCHHGRSNRIQRVRHITLPAISGTIMVVFILNLAKILNLFDPVWVLQNAMVINESDVIETYVYRLGITSSQYGISTAAGLFKSVISVGFVILVIS